jgi:transcriptional regulator with XRE-family HTH domain
MNDQNTLRILRQRHGLSQDDLARVAGVTRTTVIRLEAGVVPHPSTVTKLAAVLGVDAVWLGRELGSTRHPSDFRMQPA